MKPVDFAWHLPKSVPEAVALLGALPNARLLAGGQSLVPMLNFRIAAPDHLIDLNAIDALRFIELRGDILAIGAMTTQRDIERSELVRQYCPLLSAAIAHVGHQQTRNRGTIGGSLCHLDPSAELPVVAAALDPMLVIAGANRERRLRFRSFPAGYLSNSLVPGELVTSIEFPILPECGRGAFVEVARRPADFAIVAVAAQLVMNGTRVRSARIAIGGLAASPMRVEDIEDMIIGKELDEAFLAGAQSCAASLPAEGDSLNPAHYRQRLAGVLTRRALAGAA